MPSLEVRFRPQARADLFALYDFVAAEAGEAVAGGYIDRIEAACLSLANFPRRGTRRDDLAPGLRTIGLERRVLIAFRVGRSAVTIVNIFYGGRDFERVLRVGPRTS
jgi:toxin ParE1/3/4